MERFEGRRDTRVITVYIRSREELDLIPRPLSPLSGGSVAALGFFDGVHIAHRELVKRAKAKAVEMGLPLCIFTFFADSSVKKNTLRLYTDAEKENIFHSLGADVTVSFGFSAIKDLSAEDFIKDILVSLLDVKAAFCGYNFRFGKGAQGTADTLSRLLSDFSAEAFVLPEYRIGADEVSSSVIRDLISESKLFCAARLLGSPYFVSGSVERGLGVGGRLGMPTVNTEIPPSRLAPTPGVYATVAELSGRLYPAVTNVGACPTFGERDVHIETHIMDFSENIYGESVKVYFLERLRDEKRFESANDLIMQINIDKKKALEIIGDKKWQELGLKLQ